MKPNKIIPDSPMVLEAVNRDPAVSPIRGTATDIGAKLGHDAGYIRRCVRDGHMTKSGWTFRVVCRKEGPRAGVNEYIATNPREDPIIGPISEISALTGMSGSNIRRLIQTGRSSLNGWTVKKIGEA